MGLRTLIDIMAGRREVTVARRRDGGLEHLITGRLEREDDEVLLVASGGALHRIHRHGALVVLPADSTTEKGERND
ncbi:hypothetical protein [Nocardiopsis potens]|uniref:hypothetical protein n=1 Tax=Nocardiopsis potens TaxID=1246458 RepID=UPI00034CDA76|nr:hypothetical protein [Nocardiopsis potens]